MLVFFHTISVTCSVCFFDTLFLKQTPDDYAFSMECHSKLFAENLPFCRVYEKNVLKNAALVQWVWRLQKNNFKSAIGFPWY